jgi:hypothetical protein
VVKSDIKSEAEFSPLPPPTAAETHGNLKTKLVRARSAKRPQKDLVQCNVKVRRRTRDRFEAVFKRVLKTAAAAGGDLTKGDFFEMMVAAFEAQETGTSLVDAAKAVARTPQPSDQDREDERTEHVDVFATPDLARALKSRSKEKGWTIGATIENACAEAMHLKGEPCPHCGKARNNEEERTS